MYCMIDENLFNTCKDLNVLVSKYQEKRENFKNNKTTETFLELEVAGNNIVEFGMETRTSCDDNIETDNEELRELFNNLMATFEILHLTDSVIHALKINIKEATGPAEHQWFVQALKDNYKEFDDRINSLVPTIEKVLEIKAKSK